MKKLSTLFLLLTMIFALAACSLNGGTAVDDTARPSQLSTESTSQTGEKQGYSASFTELGGMENYLVPRCFSDEGVYASAAVMVSNNIPADVTPEYETQYYQYEQRLYFISNDGTVSRLRAYRPLSPASGLQNVSDYTQKHNIASMLLDDEGRLTILELVDESWYENYTNAAGKVSQGDYIIRQRYFIRTLDADGAELNCVQISVKEGETLNGYFPVTDGKDGFIIIDSQGLRAVDDKGKTLWQTPNEESIGQLMKLSDGRIVALTWGKGWSARTLDAQNASLGTAVELPEGVYSVFPGPNGLICYNSGDTLFGFDIDSGESHEILNWLSADILWENIAGIAAKDDGSFTGIVSRYDDSGCISELFTAEKSAAPERDTLSLGAVSMDTGLRNLIIEHNRSGERRISVRDYSSCADPAEALMADISEGSGPDIIYLEGLDTKALAASGKLEDLYPYIDADEELVREDYFENLLAAFEYEGKLVSTCQGFYISTVIAPTSVVGERSSWTLADFNDAAKAMQTDCSILEYYSTRDEVLKACLYLTHNELVDTANKSCSFETSLFTDILRFAAYFPEEYDWNSFTGESEDSTYYRLREGRQMLSIVNIYTPEDIFACDAGFESGASFVGYPMNEGSGSGLVAPAGCAISAESDHKDEAWSFLRYYFTEDCQKSYPGIPALKSLYEKRLAAAMVTDYYTDAWGDKLLNEYGEAIAIPRCSFGDEDREDDTIISFYAVSQGQKEKLEALITGTVRTPIEDEALFELVKNKTTAYFSGLLSAEEAAAVVQHAVTEYLNT